MSSENTVADRLLEDARKKTAKSESPALGKAAFIVGIVALLVSWISILGWIFGAIASASAPRPCVARCRRSRRRSPWRSVARPS
jgi:hypothetical protein